MCETCMHACRCFLLPSCEEKPCQDGRAEAARARMLQGLLVATGLLIQFRGCQGERKIQRERERESGRSRLDMNGKERERAMKTGREIERDSARVNRCAFLCSFLFLRPWYICGKPADVEF